MNFAWRSKAVALAQEKAHQIAVPLLIGAAVSLASCHRDIDVMGPDIAQSQLYRMKFANNQSPPVLVQQFLGGRRNLVDAQLMPVDLGRGTEPRVFDDRNGKGEGGGTTRDSSAASGRVADVRVFEEVNTSTGATTRYRDSVVVNVIRHGDTLFIQRESKNPTLTYVDTATFFEDLLVMRVRRWTHDPSAPTIGGGLTVPFTISYSVTR